MEKRFTAIGWVFIALSPLSVWAAGEVVLNGAQGDAKVGLDGTHLTSMEKTDYNTGLRAIGADYESEANRLKALMVAANNKFAQCALNEKMDITQAEQNNDGGSSQNPLAQAGMAAAPELMEAAKGWATGLNNRNEQMEIQATSSYSSFKTERDDFIKNHGSTALNVHPTTGAVTPGSSPCNKPSPEHAAGDTNSLLRCQSDWSDLKARADSASRDIQQARQTQAAAGNTMMQLAGALAKGALSYAGAKQQQDAEKAQIASNSRNAKAQAAAKRQICEMDAKAEWQGLQDQWAANENKRRNALATLKEQGTQPAEDNGPNVPVDALANSNISPIPIGEASPLSKKEKEVASLNNPSGGGDSGAGAAGGAGGGAGGGGSGNAQWTSGGPSGPPGGGGLALQGPDAVYGGIDGGGSGNVAIGPSPASTGPVAAGENLDDIVAMQAMAQRDGGIFLLLQRQRDRYAIHAVDLVKSIDFNRLSKNDAPASRKPATNSLGLSNKN